MSVPKSTIYLCRNVPLDNTYRHTLHFESTAIKEAYFKDKAVNTIENYTYIKEHQSIKVAFANYIAREAALKTNYLFFTNNLTGGMTYYCFVTRVEYINESVLEFFYEVDVMQTYTYTLLPSFVERNHVADDTMGLHTVDEGLELGEMVDAYEFNCVSLNELCILMLTTINPNYYTTAEPVQALAGSYNGVYSGLKVWAVDMADWVDFADIMEGLNTAGFIDGVVDMWMYPKALVTLSGEAEWGTGNVCKPVFRCDDAAMWDTIPDPYPFLGIATGDFYAPRNNKLLTYPYTFLYVTNNQGTSAVYRYERFNNTDMPDYPHKPLFSVCGGMSPDSGVKIVPMNYNGRGFNFDEGLAMGGYPTCAWDNDIYKMWLAQNQNQHRLADSTAKVSAVAGAAVALGGLAGGNLAIAGSGAALALGGAQQIASQLAQKRDMAIQPPQAKGHFSSSVNIGAGKQTFTAIRKTLSNENAAIIDDYFTMYGYKINRVMVPETACRSHFCYVKTVGCNLQAYANTEVSAKIKSIFDNGITFWKDPEKVGDYSVTNNPV